MGRIGVMSSESGHETGREVRDGESAGWRSFGVTEAMR